MVDGEGYSCLSVGAKDVATRAKCVYSGGVPQQLTLRQTRKSWTTALKDKSRVPQNTEGMSFIKSGSLISIIY